MNTQQAVAYRLLQLCRARNITPHALARSAAVPPTTLKNILHGGSRNPGIVTLKKLCDALGITLTEFFDDELFRTLQQEIR